eukprot:TRINITY_DN6082_c0_g1_i1.p1 TRINITY_DN6082_c0_g1~~TRINITY_DN6082_c0_g1_i1.p1  ORF type:complete len:581 (+),score=170.24 TRINITY_DN6082_c0_g1_i1:48-1745(+)
MFTHSLFSTLSRQSRLPQALQQSRSASRSTVPVAVNEPILGYLKDSPERHALESQIKEMKGNVLDIPIIIGGKEIRTNNTVDVVIPYDHKTVIAKVHQATEKEVKLAIDASLAARKEWDAMPQTQRLSIFLKFAELLAGPYRSVVNAATILGQGKNFRQAEIDSACELIDFQRFNVEFAQEMVTEQPVSTSEVFNRLEYRGLEGFVYAVSPFNFTAIAGNLVSAPAMMGNTVVWKPSAHAAYSGYYLMKLYEEAGLPPGVVNFVPGDPDAITKPVLAHPSFAGLHYTGSTKVFNDLWRQVGNNLDTYKTYPRLVGETGGKDFILAHPSAGVYPVATALVSGAFEYAGQKCSAASRAYIPRSLWPAIKAEVLSQMSEVKLGNSEDPNVLVNAVIHEKSADNCARYIQLAKDSDECEIIAGGNVDKSEGWFVEPTIVVTTNPKHQIITEEIFGPILTIFVYEDENYEATLDLVNDSQYALTGSLFARDRNAIAHGEERLKDAAGNFYINDKCTGAVVGQQPFGGGRKSGTNDKAGSPLNLQRWVSPRAVKETFVSPTHFSYPYMFEE